MTTTTTSKKTVAKLANLATSPLKMSPHLGAVLPPRVYAWRPDVPDHRDRAYKQTSMLSRPAVVDPLGTWNPIENQGSLGSCTGNSSTSMLEIKLAGISDTFTPLSRLMAYYNGRAIDGTVKTDAGAQIRSVIKGLVKMGVANEATWPYRVTKFNKAPSFAAVDQGSVLTTRITEAKLGYYRLNSLDDVLNCLANGNTFVFGFSVPETIDSLPKTALLRVPGQKTKMVGGHAVVGVGYDNRAGYIWVRNSWGPDWGINGLYKMPYAWFTDPRRLVDDMWTLK